MHMSKDQEKQLEPVWLQRDLGWLEFNRRVLCEAQDPRNPMMERLKFLAIFSSNLDEFFMKRMELIKSLMATNSGAPWESHLPEQIHKQLSPLLEQQHQTFVDLRRKLASEGIDLLDFDQLTQPQQQSIREGFRKNILPILTPLAVDPSHPFPFLSNLSISLGVLLKDARFPDGCFARLKIPSSLQGWIPLEQENSDRIQLVSTVSTIQANLADLSLIHI